MTGLDPTALDGMSLVLVWTAIAVYLLAFIAYTIDLAQRSVRVEAGREELVAVGAGRVADGQASRSRLIPSDGDSPRRRPRARLFARIGTSLTVLALLLHAGGTVLRGVAAERVPWANMYEFALTGTALIVAVYLLVLFRYDLRFLGAFLIGMVVLLLGGATVSFYVQVVPLMDPLKSVWLVIHVFVASLATALFAIACGLAVTQLAQSRRERLQSSAEDGAARPAGSRFLSTLPSAESLESLAYRFAIVGFVFWTFTLIAGAIWANDSWGRYWGFDTKEVWTFVIWVLYAGYIHARATRGWRGTRSAWLCIIGFVTVLFNFTVVNMFFKGLHSYSGLS